MNNIARIAWSFLSFFVSYMVCLVHNLQVAASVLELNFCCRLSRKLSRATILMRKILYMPVRWQSIFWIIFIWNWTKIVWCKMARSINFYMLLVWAFLQVVIRDVPWLFLHRDCCILFSGWGISHIVDFVHQQFTATHTGSWFLALWGNTWRPIWRGNRCFRHSYSMC